MGVESKAKSFKGLVLVVFVFFFFKQKTAYEIGTGDWSSDVCSSDLSSQVTSALLTQPLSLRCIDNG